MSNRFVALAMALVLCATVMASANAKSWIPIYNPKGPSVMVTTDGLQTIGRSTRNGFVGGAVGGLGMALAVAAGIITAPLTPLAYAVPVVTGTVGGFANGVLTASDNDDIRLWRP